MIMRLVNNRSLLKQTGAGKLAFECYLCGETEPGIELICKHCWEDLLTEGDCSHYHCEVNTYLDYTFALSRYRFPLDKLLFALKYQGKLILARELGRKLAEKINETGLEKPDYIIPVPLHSIRTLTRGFNQAKELAATVSANLSIPVLSLSTRRIRNTRPQFLLSAGERRINMKDAFRVTRNGLSGSFVIIDDIVTTGSTANELAERLRAAGANKVALWACARSD